MSPAIRETILKMSVPERIELVGDICETLEGQNLPLLDWQKGILEERLVAHEKTPHAAQPWDQVKARLLANREARRTAP